MGQGPIRQPSESTEWSDVAGRVTWGGPAQETRDSTTGEIMDELPTVNLQELERLAIQQALQRVDGNRVAAAKLLGIGRATLYRKLQELKSSGIAVESSRDV
jgi:DNA-binding NtrC family response regulator